MKVILFTDGACSGNPGPGGWAAILWDGVNRVRELGGAARATTNNRMELTAVIEGIKAVRDRGAEVAIYSDSTYVIRGATAWMWGWKRNGFKNGEGQDVANADLWAEMISVVAPRRKLLAWHYVRGHSAVPGNERCDELSVEFSQGRRPRLYEGSYAGYGVDLVDVPEDTALPALKPSAGTKKAGWYLSYVDGQLSKDAEWKTCEARVKGRRGAKFKKVSSPEEEAEVLAAWGLGNGKG